MFLSRSILSRSTRPALNGSLLVTALVIATTVIAGYPAFAADSAPALKFKLGKHDFGKVVATKSSEPVAVTVTNKSKSESINFTSIVAAEPFSIQSDKCSGAPLAPGRSCKVEVVFHPLVAGNVSDRNALTFTDSAPNSTQHVELDGQGIVGSFL